MKIGSTPVHTFETNVDLSEAHILITYVQNDTIVLEKKTSDCSINGSVVVCKLTQEDTLKFEEGAVKIQLRYIMRDGTTDASDIVKVSAEEILHEGPISYES